MNIEGLIIKYSLGLGFVVITLVFGIKIVMVVVLAAKLKLAAFMTAHEWIKTLIELVSKGAAAK